MNEMAKKLSSWCVAALLCLAGGVSRAQVTAPAAPVAPPPVLQEHQELGTRTMLSGPGDYYRLQPGDSVTISFRYTPEFNDEVTLGPDGRVVLKSTGNIRLAGLTLPEVERTIKTASAAKLVDPDVTVTLKDFERPHVVVAGEVVSPGKFELRKPTTVLQAILMAGGPKEDGAMGRVLLFRKLNTEVAEVHVLQLGRYKDKDRAKNDMILQPDDMILVRHDNASKVERFVKMTNLGMYFNPLSGIF